MFSAGPRALTHGRSGMSRVAGGSGYHVRSAGHMSNAAYHKSTKRHAGAVTAFMYIVITLGVMAMIGFVVVLISRRKNEMLLHKLESINENEAENLLRQRFSKDAHSVASAQSVADAVHARDVNDTRHKTTESSGSEADRYADRSARQKLEEKKSELQDAADTKMEMIDRAEARAASNEERKKDEIQRKRIEEDLKKALAENDAAMKKLEEVERAQRALGGSSSTELDHTDKEPLHPYHPTSNATSAGSSGSPRAPVKISHEHRRHEHVPTLLDAIELKRKELFRTQELVDYGSILVISNGSHMLAKKKAARLFMYKEFLSDKEMQYLLALTKIVDGGNEQKKKREPIVKVRGGANDFAGAKEMANKTKRTVMYPTYDSYVYDLDDNLMRKTPTKEKESGEKSSPSPDNEGGAFEISFSDIIIAKIVHRISTWCHIPFRNLESFSIDAFDSETTYSSYYASSRNETFNDRLATVFIPLTQFDDDSDVTVDTNVADASSHYNVVVFPYMEPTQQQLRLSRATFADADAHTQPSAGGDASYGRSAGTHRQADVCNDREHKLTINASKGDALLVWSMTVGGDALKSSTYVHCRLPPPPMAADEGVENAMRISNGSDVGASRVAKKRYVVTVHYTVSGVRPPGEKGTIHRMIYREDHKCEDKSLACASWAKSGECEKNPGYMNTACSLSCNLCTDFS